jgi:hypothetical protein
LKLLESKTPEEVFLFGINPNPPDQIQPFLEYLAGLVKFTIHEKKGELTMPQLEHLTGHSEMTNLSGLNWLSAHGDIQFRFLTSGSISLKAKGIVDSAKLEIVEKELAQHINEARAFRSYYMRTEIANLL